MLKKSRLRLGFSPGLGRMYVAHNMLKNIRKNFLPIL